MPLGAASDTGFQKISCTGTVWWDKVFSQSKWSINSKKVCIFLEKPLEWKVILDIYAKGLVSNVSL